MLVNYIGAMPTQVLQNGQTGMQSAEQQVAGASNEIARQPLYQQEQREVREQAQAGSQANAEKTSTEQTGLQLSPQRSSMMRELINLSEGEMAFKANARSIEAAQTMFDSLLAAGRDPDTRADQRGDSL
ncbi:hypothetical protein CWE12_05380 [Aliidiomarina sedimenti]|uniref:Uncharacterized protein n=1 Tax=Aliidiomarina sedimenti TaxID=1933879 RepID=A0ABY0C033_9GAMM|nr:hypothetical protein [Aliidiomarina sedimenti]RUO30677.1 hypothetical protein CWE12_05380 [Aliidiomarina sedimenti]